MTTAQAPEPPEPQRVVTPLTEAAIFMVLTVGAGAEEALRQALAEVAGLTRAVGFRVPTGELSCVVGLGSDLWDRLFGVPRPAQLHPFRELRGPRHTAVTTPGDVLFHLRARQFDLCFELAGQLLARLGGGVRVVDEVHGFKFFEQRDLLGFVDGTENPDGAAAGRAVYLGDEDPAFAGGSYVIVQKYLHDLVTWNALPVEDQQRAIGRTKLSDIELSDEVKPADSHVALNTIVGGDGVQRQIFRCNMPFGQVGQTVWGTYFIGYGRDPGVTELMLQHMFLGDPPGTTDRILEFSTAVTGGLFFVPSADFLDDPPAFSEGTPAPVHAEHRPGVGEGSLGLGSLRPSPAGR